MFLWTVYKSFNKGVNVIWTQNLLLGWVITILYCILPYSIVNIVEALCKPLVVCIKYLITLNDILLIFLEFEHRWLTILPLFIINTKNNNLVRSNKTTNIDILKKWKNVVILYYFSQKIITWTRVMTTCMIIIINNKP